MILHSRSSVAISLFVSLCFLSFWCHYRFLLRVTGNHSTKTDRSVNLYSCSTSQTSRSKDFRNLTMKFKPLLSAWVPRLIPMENCSVVVGYSTVPVALGISECSAFQAFTSRSSIMTPKMVSLLLYVAPQILLKWNRGEGSHKPAFFFNILPGQDLDSLISNCSDEKCSGWESSEMDEMCETFMFWSPKTAIAQTFYLSKGFHCHLRQGKHCWVSYR